ncbi:hypothetical protein AMAG_02677 [Allomyces macrogynus ATCC 38327]|uniref:Protein-S-isoprenylcysteine O-methyltransferase n=1 Tax=Allomyces macrogynus (strain ATCC 38327) TaxID=578462 RepID=A0A0L0S2W1_ALLM3|nr:hypothetical protein AMAG_02677 [Allomyces macrogynus ATCC 38327]|eukprot:KNE56907.1 hypothetical protein AMAG_02677 [Allomyces macrogynus ATCC 38327]
MAVPRPSAAPRQTSPFGATMQRDFARPRLLDGTHSPHNIALYAFGVGGVAGLGLALAFLGTTLQWFGLYLVALAVFHFFEYEVTALYNAPKLNLGSFLIPHGPEYVAATIASLVESLVVGFLFPSWAQSWPLLLRFVGLALVLVGQSARSLAMIQAGTNFSHLIEHYKRLNHELVTTGVYSYLRHPSYFGYFWWGVGTQLLCGNLVCAFAYAGALWYFFRERIPYEEELLVKFFETEYVTYRARTKVGIPFIR